MVLVGEPLDEVDLLERQLHGVAVLRVTWHVRRPKLRKPQRARFMPAPEGNDQGELVPSTCADNSTYQKN